MSPHSRHAAVLFVALGVLPGWAAAPPEPDATPTAAQIAGWIKELGADRFSVREAAEKQLVAAGAAALDAVAEAATSSDAEVRSRALRMLKRGLFAKDAAVQSSARKHLQTLAQFSDAAVVVAAQRALREAERARSGESTEFDGVEQWLAGRRPRAGRLVLEGKLLPRPAIELPAAGARAVTRMEMRMGLGGVGGARSISISIRDGRRSIDVKTGNERVEIEDSNDDGIKVRITKQEQSGESVTKEYAAPDAETLQRRHPEAYAAYKRYAEQEGPRIIVAPDVPGGISR